MHAIVSVIGRDRVGITAGVCTLLASFNINIMDITQTVMEGMFTMTMLVDLTACSCVYGEVVDALSAKGEEMGLSIRLQREEIFQAMHRI